tara:strand:- start:345 stop:1340 length:996 start_codon:yes stop_codon:yes gene_type:complete
MILLSFGTRPEWIKIKPLLEKLNESIPYRLLFTGQHTDLLSDIKSPVPIINLKITDGGNRLDSIVQSVMNCEHIFEQVDAVLVQGDTTSAFSIALACFHRKIKVIHLEAGLRTYDKAQPYPEEFNRQAISRIADIHLCPTDTSKQYLVDEKTQGTIEVVGNTVLDNLVGIETEYSNKVIVTMHRRENHHNMSEWFSEISKIAKSNSDLEFIIPLHPNPNVRKHKSLLEGVKVVGPMEYDEFISLLAKSKLVITDSGGLQEETSFLGKKCIVCRKKTERMEGVGHFAHICQKPSDLSSLFEQVITDYEISGPSPYGDGNSSERILEILKNEI